MVPPSPSPSERPTQKPRKGLLSFNQSKCPDHSGAFRLTRNNQSRMGLFKIEIV